MLEVIGWCINDRAIAANNILISWVLRYSWHAYRVALMHAWLCPACCAVPQVVELQLPFPNHLLENAKRSYTEKHPLGRDKEQLSRLRSDIGSANERGERVLEYTVTCDSPFFTAPAAVTLKSSGPPQSAQDATAASSPAVTRLNSPTQGARVASGMQQQQGHAGGNMLKLSLKPVGPGVYPARLVLTSAYDVRHVELQVTAQARGQACILELECPARQQVSCYSENELLTSKTLTSNRVFGSLVKAAI